MHEGTTRHHPWQRLVPPAPIWARVGLDSLPDQIDEELALLLWRALRDIMDGIQSISADQQIVPRPPAHVSERIQAATAAAPEVEAALRHLGSYRWLRPSSEETASHCRDLSIWAERNDLLALSALFAEAAAHASPSLPSFARQAGRLNRRVGNDNRAMDWYERALALARRLRDDPELHAYARDEYVKTRLWYGFLRFQHGEHLLAMQHYRAAGTVARKYGPLRLAGVAHHNLLTIASDRGTYKRGESHARTALAYYPVHHPRIPHLLHDYAYLLLRNRFYDPALLLLEASSPLIQLPHERVVVCGNLARAAGGVRDQERYAAAMAQIEEIVTHTNENASRGMLGLADGALQMGETERARAFAIRTIHYAQLRGDREPEMLATALLQKLESPDIRSAPSSQAPISAYDLAGAMVERLRRWTARPRGQAVRMLQRLKAKGSAEHSPRTTGSV